MQATETVRKILSHYESDPPGVDSGPAPRRPSLPRCVPGHTSHHAIFGQNTSFSGQDSAVLGHDPASLGKRTLVRAPEPHCRTRPRLRMSQHLAPLTLEPHHRFRSHGLAHALQKTNSRTA